MKKLFTLLLFAVILQINAQCYDKLTSGGAALGLKSDGTLWVWGDNYLGELGLGLPSSTNTYVPTHLGSSTWKDITSGAGYSGAIKTDGTLWTWGFNGGGQLGIGSVGTQLHNIPIQIGTANNWNVIRASGANTFGIKTDGTLWAWGANSQGQLGNGTSTNTYSPTQSGNLTNWLEIITGSVHYYGIKTDGTIWSWGRNINGQLGDGTNINKFTPVLFGNTTIWKVIACGEEHSMGIKTDGTLWSWGKSTSGCLGLGSTTGTINVPTQIGNATNWKTISIGKDNSLGIKTDGTLWAWGSNSLGQLGLGTLTLTNIPIQVGIATDWKDLEVGSNQVTFAMKTNGSLWACGAGFGLGDGTNISKNIFTQINCIISGIEEVTYDSNRFSIYPNPSSNILHIEKSKNNSIDSFIIVDVLGRKVLEEKENTAQINIQALEKGIYQLLITSEGKSYSSKFIKE